MKLNLFVKSVQTASQTIVATPANPAQATAKPVTVATDTLGEKKPAPPSKNAGLKLGAKMVGGTIAAGGLTAFAIYGIIAAAPHISALIGVIAAAPATIPILATIGAVLGTVAIVLVVRAIYKKVKKDQLRNANMEAAKREAAALTNGQTPAAATTPATPVADAQTPASVAGGSLRRTNSNVSLTPTEASMMNTINNNTPEQNAALLANVEATSGEYAEYFNSITTERETGTPEEKAQIAVADKEMRKANVIRDALTPDTAVVV